MTDATTATDHLDALEELAGDVEFRLLDAEEMMLRRPRPGHRRRTDQPGRRRAWAARGDPRQRAERATVTAETVAACTASLRDGRAWPR